MTEETTKKQFTPEEIVGFMTKAYGAMIENQKNFTDIAVSRATIIAEKHNVNLEKSQILGVSFTPDYAIVGMLYTPVLLTGPEDTGEPKPINVPVPVECLFPMDDSWIDIYEQKLAEAESNVKAAKSSGELSKAMTGGATVN